MLKIKQLMFENGESFNFSEQWSENVFETHSCYNLIIHSLPGNKFLINDDDKNGPITIGGTGIFQLDFDIYPITSLRIHEGNKYRTYPTIIDFVYQALEEE